MSKYIAILFPLFLISCISEQERLNKDLYSYVAEGNITKAKECIKNGADVNYDKTSGRFTPLREAMSRKDISTVKMLLENGANIDARDRYGRSALTTESHYLNFDMVKFLLENKADVNFKDEWGNSPLSNACCPNMFLENIGDKDIETVKILLKYGANINSRDMYGVTPLYKACHKDNLRVIKILVENGAEINALIYDKSGTPLDMARDPEVIKYLREHGAKTAKELEKEATK